MARPVKSGLDYFPFDIDTFQDLRIRKLIKYQGGKAVTVYALLLCIIYKDGYYSRWDEELPFIISEQSGYEEAYIREVINCCLNIGLLSKALYESDRVLTSRGIQLRYQKICALSRRSCVISEFTLISSEETEVIAEETPVNSAKSTQSKVKKSKVNKTSSDDDAKPPSPPPGICNKTSSLRGRKPSDPIDACLAWVADKADRLAEENGVEAATILLHARQIAQQWRLTNEYDRARTNTHMASSIRSRILKSRSATDSAPRPVTATDRRIAAEEEADRLERENRRKIDGRASLQAYFKSQGLPPDTNIRDVLPPAESSTH